MYHGHRFTHRHQNHNDGQENQRHNEDDHVNLLGLFCPLFWYASFVENENDQTNKTLCESENVDGKRRGQARGAMDRQKKQLFFGSASKYQSHQKKTGDGGERNQKKRVKVDALAHRQKLPRFPGEYPTPS